jgi:hypothetical protein
VRFPLKNFCQERFHLNRRNGEFPNGRQSGEFEKKAQFFVNHVFSSSFSVEIQN